MGECIKKLNIDLRTNMFLKDIVEFFERATFYMQNRHNRKYFYTNKMFKMKINGIFVVILYKFTKNLLKT